MKLMNPSILTRSKTWLFLAAMLLLTTILLAACSGGDQLLLGEFNRNGEAEIFLARLGDENSDWQSLAEDVRAAHLFPGQYAAFVPDTKRIVLWFIDGDELVVEQMKMGDEQPTKVFDADENDLVFGSILTDPFAIYLNEAPDFDNYRCYVSLDGAEAERLARSNNCIISEKGVVAIENDNGEMTVTVVSLDGDDETVILDAVEDVSVVRWNEKLTKFVYVEQNRRDEQLVLVETGDEEGVALGDEFALIDSAGFLPDGKTVYVIARVNKDDEEMGLFINGEGDPLIEDDFIAWVGASEDGEYALFKTLNFREETIFVYSVDDQTVTEVTGNDVIAMTTYANKNRLLLQVGDKDDVTILSTKADGTDSVELFSDDNYVINFNLLDRETDRLFSLMSDNDGLKFLFVTGLEEEDGYFLLEEWEAITLLNASDKVAIFAGQENSGDDWVLYSIPLEDGAKEVELDDDGKDGFQNLFFSGNGRSLLYTARDNGLEDIEVRQVPVDGSKNPERLYRDILLLDVSWDGQSNLEVLR